MVTSPTDQNSHQRQFRVTEVLLDGTATVNCISSRTAEALSLPLHNDTDMTITNANGREQQLYHSVLFHFTIDGIPSEVKAYVFKGIVPYSLLLGRPWLKQVGIKGDYARDTYTIDDGKGGRQELPSSGTEEQSIPNNSVRMICKVKTQMIYGGRHKTLGKWEPQRS